MNLHSFATALASVVSVLTAFVFALVFSIPDRTEAFFRLVGVNDFLIGFGLVSLVLSLELMRRLESKRPLNGDSR